MTQEDKSRELTPDEMRADPKTSVSRDDPEPNEMTTWDGAGNPIKHVFADDEGGHLSEGTGATTDEAMKDARDSSHTLGTKDAGPGLKDAGSG